MRASPAVCLTALLALAATPLSAAAGGDWNKGRAKSAQCVACHGVSGLAPNPMFPHLAGQNASYLEIQLEDFRTGERYHPVMSPIAQVLTREDIEDLVTYYSNIEAQARN